MVKIKRQIRNPIDVCGPWNSNNSNSKTLPFDFRLETGVEGGGVKKFFKIVVE